MTSEKVSIPFIWEALAFVCFTSANWVHPTALLWQKLVTQGFMFMLCGVAYACAEDGVRW